MRIDGCSLVPRWLTFSIGVAAVSLMTVPAGAQRPTAGQRPTAVPDLQGVWDTGTATPLTRPAPFATKSHFTPEEAAAFERDNETRILSVFSPEDRLASDLNDIYQETVSLKVTDDLRTSLIIDPPNGQLPEQLPAAKARADARPKRTFDDPETLTLDERCLMGV
ncbi:MAG: hypothetical protein U0Q11_05415, partial [Vicinamibacterales bacterium]